MRYVAMTLGLAALATVIVGIKKERPAIYVTGQIMGVVTLLLLYLMLA